MSKVAVFISDIHLGSNDRLNDFDSHGEFEEFLNEKIATEFPNEELDLVLLGDVFDLWQAVPKKELPRDADQQDDPHHTRDQGWDRPQANHGSFSGDADAHRGTKTGHHAIPDRAPLGLRALEYIPQQFVHQLGGKEVGCHQPRDGRQLVDVESHHALS